MAKLKIAGVPPLDGEYDLDLATFTNRELHTIKDLSGVRAGELKAAFAAADNDLIVALAVIVLRRAGREVNPDQIWEADVGAITVDMRTEEVVEERPPASPMTSGAASADVDADTPTDTTTRSGPVSGNGGDPNPPDQSPTGPLGSEKSSISVPSTSAT